MGSSSGSRTLVAVCAAMVVLLAALAVVQYRWSTRVADADAQREREHLDSAASLFANQFNSLAEQTMEFLQKEARAALEKGEPLAALPKLIGELYYLDVPPQGTPKAQRLGAGSGFVPSAVPEWIGPPRCALTAVDDPPALVVPVYEVTTTTTDNPDAGGIRILKRISRPPDRCFVARLDQGYLGDTLFPQLIRQSFGETSAKEYDFAVVALNGAHKPLYGTPLRADVRRPFFSIRPDRLTPFKDPLDTLPPPGKDVIFTERRQAAFFIRGVHPGDLFGPGVWELNVAHKGVPLTIAFDRTRRWNLLLSLGVEALLLTAIAFLVVGTRRMQRLADQKMQFVAGVSHELRTPASAIALLSRNQADGLVTGVEKVKQYGELIHQQSRRLNEMVEQSLAYAGIQSGRRPVRNEIDLLSLIADAVAARREDLARAGFEIEVATSPTLPVIQGDARLLRTAFDNLLDNAQKYAGAGRWIRVSASYSIEQKEVRVSVEDRGAGIDPADQLEIFEPFSRSRAAIEAQVPGSGLGLSLVRSAAEAHRGTVTLESAPGRGSTFTLHLPV